MATQVEDIKWLPSNTDRRFMVDGFGFKNPLCTTYFLTHFHSDHTIGLTKNFDYGLVYTSHVTAQLLVHDMGLPAKCVVTLPMHKPIDMHGCRVTLLDANHCPGAIMLLIEVLVDRNNKPLPKPEVILHTGDCRWEDWLATQIPRNLKVNTVFLDTTYAIPRYTFPSQATVLEALADEIAGLLAAQPSTLLVVAAYHIGKEKVYLGLAKKLGLKVWCSEAKRRVLRMLELPDEDMAVLTDKPEEAGLHVTGWGMRPDQLHAKFLKVAQSAGAQLPDSLLESPLKAKQEPGTGVKTQVKTEQNSRTTPGPVISRGPSNDLEGDNDIRVLEQGDDVAPEGVFYEGAEEEADAAAAIKGRWQHIVGIKATGWSYRKKGKSLVSRWVVGPVTVLGAPYSEHSSWLELCSCVRTLRPSRLVPTVNAATPAASKAIVEKFVNFMDLSRQRGRMDMYCLKKSPSTSMPDVSPANPFKESDPGTFGHSKSAPSLLKDSNDKASSVAAVSNTQSLQPRISLQTPVTIELDEEGSIHDKNGIANSVTHQHVPAELQVVEAKQQFNGAVQQAGQNTAAQLQQGASLAKDTSRAVADLVLLNDGEESEQEEDARVAERLFGNPTCTCHERPRLADDTGDGAAVNTVAADATTTTSRAEGAAKKYNIFPDGSKEEDIATHSRSNSLTADPLLYDTSGKQQPVQQTSLGSIVKQPHKLSANLNEELVSPSATFVLPIVHLKTPTQSPGMVHGDSSSGRTVQYSPDMDTELHDVPNAVAATSDTDKHEQSPQLSPQTGHAALPGDDITSSVPEADMTEADTVGNVATGTVTDDLPQQQNQPAQELEGVSKEDGQSRETAFQIDDVDLTEQQRIWDAIQQEAARKARLKSNSNKLSSARTSSAKDRNRNIKQEPSNNRTAETSMGQMAESKEFTSPGKSSISASKVAKRKSSGSLPKSAGNGKRAKSGNIVNAGTVDNPVMLDDPMSSKQTPVKHASLDSQPSAQRSIQSFFSPVSTGVKRESC